MKGLRILHVSSLRPIKKQTIVLFGSNFGCKKYLKYKKIEIVEESIENISKKCKGKYM